MSASLEARVKRLEQKQALDERERNKLPQRLADPMAPRLGRHIAILTQDLTRFEEATANIMVWSRDDLRDSGVEITIRDFQLSSSQTLLSGTLLWVVWDKTTWTWISTFLTQQVGIPFINMSGESIPPCGIMDWYGDFAIGGTPYVKCYKPGYLIRRRWLVNGTSFVNPGATAVGSWLDDISGFGAIDAGSITQVVPHSGFGPRPGSWYLYPNMYGFQCVGSTLGFNGSWIAHFRQEEQNHLKVKLLDNLEAGSFTLAQHMFRNHLAQFVESPFTDEIVVRDGGYLRAGESISSNRSEPIIADIEWMGSFWELTNAQCEAEEASEGDGSQNSPGGGQMAGQFAINAVAPPSSPAFPSL